MKFSPKDRRERGRTSRVADANEFYPKIHIYRDSDATILNVLVFSVEQLAELEQNDVVVEPINHQFGVDYTILRANFNGQVAGIYNNDGCIRWGSEIASLEDDYSFEDC